MLLARVLDLVVADAVQALDEHHHRGDAGAGDLGGIVQRPRGQAMELAAGLHDRFVAEGEQLGVEVDRLDLPDPVPRHLALRRGAELSAGPAGPGARPAGPACTEWPWAGGARAPPDAPREVPGLGGDGAVRAAAAVPVGEVIAHLAHLPRREERVA